jgi:hypothetical protein
MKTMKYKKRKELRSGEVFSIEHAINSLIKGLFRDMKELQMICAGDTLKFDIRYDYAEISCTLLDVGVNNYEPAAIYRNGETTAVKWADGTITKVKRQEEDADSIYSAFTAALAKKALGSNTKISKILDKKTVIQKKGKTV